MLDRADPFARGADCHHFARQKEVRVGLVLGAPHASAQLIQIRQTKLIRAIDDDRVCVWNIETAFDDGGANEDICFPGYESRHHCFELVGIHLAVSDFNSGVRTKIDNAIAHPLNARDPIMQKEYLPLAFQFAFNRGANDQVIIR